MLTLLHHLSLRWQVFCSSYVELKLVLLLMVVVSLFAGVQFCTKATPMDGIFCLYCLVLLWVFTQPSRQRARREDL